MVVVGDKPRRLREDRRLASGSCGSLLTMGSPARGLAASGPRARGALRVLAYSDSKLYSGAEAVLRDAVVGLAQRPEFEMTCAAPHENTELRVALGEAAGRAAIDVPAQPPAAGAVHLYDPRRRRRVARVLAEADADVLLVNLPSAEYGATPLSVRPNGMAAVGLLHVPGSLRDLGFKLGGLRERLARRALRGLDAVCPLTESAGKTYAEVWSQNGTLIRTVRLPRPSLVAVDRKRSRLELGLPEGPVIGIAGRISIKQKGHDIFVRAAREMLTRRGELRFAVAGSGRDEEDVIQMVEKENLGDRFAFLGHVEPISVFLSAIDAIALPSRFEGLPLIALESIALGVPGVAASVDGLRDVWPHEWQVPPGDPRALAEGLERVLGAGPDDRDRLLAEGRERLRRSTTEDMAADLGRVLREVAPNA
jgi:glycosyltransferase involved in cell wall biosynthesis